MFGEDLLVRTRLLPPRLPPRWLHRARLDQLLAQAADSPLTIVSASAGYGKSSALASFVVHGGWPVVWYTLGGGGDDPLVFLVHLVYAFRGLVPQAGDRTLAILEHSERGPHAWEQALDALINDLVAALDDETILILDDYHLADDLPDIAGLIERLITDHPPLLHVILSTRRRPQLACLSTFQVRGELVEIGETDLAFTAAEIGELFASYGLALNAEETQIIGQQTGGWAIALQLLWQGARRAGHWERAAPESEPTVASSPLLRSSFSREALFTYLAQEVLARQPPEIQDFLLRSSVLAELRPDACNRILQIADAAERLRTCYQRGLFLAFQEPGQYSYHPLFQAFLQEHAQANLPGWMDLHARAAAYYEAQDDGEQALQHLIARADNVGAAAALERWAPDWLAAGRLVTLLTWIDQLPPAVLDAHPRLLLAQGDAARLLARFDLALDSYTRVALLYEAAMDALGQAQALRGQALVYLDTVQPSRATELLRRAYKLLPPNQRTARAELLSLMAENRLNLGRADQAARLYQIAARLDPSHAEAADGPRVLLRLGRLNEARALLEAALPQDRAAIARGRPPEAHREMTLLLSQICALQGEAEAALRYAREGLDAALQLGSALFEAEAHIAAGHALQLALIPDLPAINGHYLQAMALADAFGVPRTKVEAYMGLALLHGFGGDLAATQAAAHAGLAIVERSGDAWTAALLWTALGAAGAASGTPEAESWLHEAAQRYRASHDTYGQAIAQLWLSVWHHHAGRLDAAARHAHATLALAEQHGYDGLLTTTTLFGPRDQMMLVPVLLVGRQDSDQRSFAQALLVRGFPAIAADEATQTYHPGSTLRIQMLGRLQVWRGNVAVESREWQRKKAQQMLAFLLTHRDHWLLREQICDALWPEEAAGDAEAQFKVTLNGLNSVLEPGRPPRTPPFYIRRDGTAYRFYPSAGVWLDVEIFEAQIAAARLHLATGPSPDADAVLEALSTAVDLYQGEYLSDWLYEEWTQEERSRLALRYLEAATTLADLLLGRDQPADAIRTCELILARDPAWEDAYAILMRAYARQGNRRQALATYERCVRNLRQHLGVEPLPKTTHIYEELKL